MKNSPTRRRLLLISTLLVLSSVVVAGVYTRASRPQKNQKDRPKTYEAAKVTTAPQVISAIKGLEISGVSLIKEGTPEAAIAITVTNQRDEDVMAVDFVAGQGKSTSSGLTIDGLLEEDSPLVIIPRHSLKTFAWNLGSIMDGETISLAVAVFSDGKEEGDPHYLRGLKSTRSEHQKRRREAKAKNGGQQ